MGVARESWRFLLSVPSFPSFVVWRCDLFCDLVSVARVVIWYQWETWRRVAVPFCVARYCVGDLAAVATTGSRGRSGSASSVGAWRGVGGLVADPVENFAYNRKKRRQREKNKKILKKVLTAKNICGIL